ncbi:zinc finger BED domain-containing protein 4-like [Homalodisca vitripennis]|nr:zinc finger BED domain-containing protein 4-like [Homalodisca vitripennis]
MGLEPKKLIQEVSTRWNSTFYMVSRFVELQDAVKTTIALINKNLPVLSEEEWGLCKELSTILRPFEEVTSQISGERYVTGSQVIPLTRGLMSVCKKMQKEPFKPVIQNIINELLHGLEKRMENVEHSKTIALATLLDPRFKLAVFKDETAKQLIKKTCTELLAAIWTETHGKPCTADDEEIGNTQNKDGNVDSAKFSVWEDVDNIIAKEKPTGTKTSAAIVELNRYLDDSYLGRKKDPMGWWKENQHVYPIMSKLVKLKFNVMATSVPCERLFSKAGNFLTERRSRLSSKRAEQLLF